MGCRRYIIVLSIARLNEIMINVCFVGDFGWERLSDASASNRDVAFLVFILYRGDFFFMFYHLFWL